MTIKMCSGDLFEDDAAVLVVTTNLVGPMGAGIARQARDKYPGLELDYKKECREGRMRPGKLFPWTIPPELRARPALIVCMPTKRHWRDNSLLADVVFGVRSLAHVCKESECPSAALPPVGCGLGGLRWDDVLPIIEEAFTDHATEVRVYAP